VTTELSFANQHHAWFTEDGALMLYDNREGRRESSRILTIEIDEAAGLADITAVQDLGTRCAKKGSSAITESGHLLASCATDDSIREYDTSGALVWQATFTCDDGSDPSDTSRALPITPTGW